MSAPIPNDSRHDVMLAAMECFILMGDPQSKIYRHTHKNGFQEYISLSDVLQHAKNCAIDYERIRLTIVSDPDLLANYRFVRSHLWRDTASDAPGNNKG